MDGSAKSSSDADVQFAKIDTVILGEGAIKLKVEVF